ncbi:V-SNARE_N-terminal domain-containing protein [Hexamita inflata]|uniref:V-SNARE_N-terminal domain-containing protein n=1 Tax=Hexamita inflata TaxID=28002 RepID=A0ABP1GS51_9EUKA
MQQVQFPNQQSYTNRFKPSAQLLKITQKRMEEAQRMLQHLRIRLNQAKSNTERASIQKHIEQLQIEFQRYLQELKPETAKPINQQQQLLNQNSIEYLEEEPVQAPIQSIPQKQPSLVEQNLQRRLNNQPPKTEPKPRTWTELTKNNVSKLNSEEQQLQQELKMKNLNYQADLKREDDLRTSKPTPPKNEPKIYDSNAFKTLGANDLKIKEDIPHSKTQLRIEMETELKSRPQKTKEPFVPFDGLPKDTIVNGKVKTSAIPDKFMKGKEFDNENKIAPDRTNLTIVYKQKKELEQKELNETKQQELETERRKQIAEKYKQEQLTKRNTLTESALEENAHNTQKTIQDRYGGLRHISDQEINFGANYYNRNKILQKQNTQNDPQFDDNSYLKRIDKADTKRAQQNHVAVVPLTEEEKYDIELKKFLLRNPQRKPLDESDVAIFNEHINHQNTKIQERQAQLLKEKQYNQELQEHDKIKSLQNEDIIDERCASMNSAPRMVKGRIW